MCLNSTLLDGSLATDPVLLEPTVLACSPGAPQMRLPYCTFILDCGPDLSAVPVVAYAREALKCKTLYRGSHVRVVGRLALPSDSNLPPGLHILAEAIEVKWPRQSAPGPALPAPVSSLPEAVHG